MTDVKTRIMVRTALFAALTCISTFIIKIPTPGTGGYIHPGDAMVILSGVFLGPLYGAAAAGIGSAMADILGGYFFYAPITLLIKGITAFVCGRIFRSSSPAIFGERIKCLMCGLFSTIFVAGGYLLFELLIYGRAAIASLPSNLIQGLSGLVISSLLYAPIKKITKTLA